MHGSRNMVSISSPCMSLVPITVLNHATAMRRTSFRPGSCEPGLAFRLLRQGQEERCHSGRPRDASRHVRGRLRPFRKGRAFHAFGFPQYHGDIAVEGQIVQGPGAANLRRQPQFPSPYALSQTRPTVAVSKCLAPIRCTQSKSSSTRMIQPFSPTCQYGTRVNNLAPRC